MARRSGKPIGSDGVNGNGQHIVGSSPALLSLLDAARRVAPTLAPVIIEGQRGTGKELIAWYVHGHSSRKGPCIAVNSSHLYGDLAMNELFGHERNTYTGAVAAAAGLCEQAHGGTLFLDEVAELDPLVQKLLLRALQGGLVRRIGGVEMAVDLRIVAATNAHLEQRVRDGLFRADLYDRLRTYILKVPPLSARGGDALELAEWFLRHDALTRNRRILISPSGAWVLLRYRWPGNVRELESVLRAVVIDGCGYRIEAGHLLPRLQLPRFSISPTWSEARDEVLCALMVYGSLSSDQIGRLTGIGRDCVLARVNALIEEGRADRTGGARATRYRAMDEYGWPVGGEARLPSRMKRERRKKEPKRAEVRPRGRPRGTVFPPRPNVPWHHRKVVLGVSGREAGVVPFRIGV